MEIKIMIAEDEQFAQEELLYFLESEDNVILCPIAETGEQLIDLYFEHQPDVLFLDIEMPGLSGIEAAKQIVKATSDQPYFVFTTAYETYAIEAIEVEAVDYLLKPFNKARFRQALERIRRRLLAEEMLHDQKNGNTSKLLIDDGEKMIVIEPETIYFAVPGQRALEIHTKDEVLESKLTLQELERRLADFPFYRTHRSYLVNLNYIQAITPWFNGAYNITLKDKENTIIPVSRSARKELFRKFGH